MSKIKLVGKPKKETPVFEVRCEGCDKTLLLVPAGGELVVKGR